MLMDLLKKHEEDMTGQILLRWTRELIWEHLVSDVPKESGKEIIPDACLSEERLKMCIRREKSDLKIGFE